MQHYITEVIDSWQDFEDAEQRIIAAGFPYRVVKEYDNGRYRIREASYELDHKLGDWMYFGGVNAGYFFFKKEQDALWAALVL